jgi:hypothetical protein
MKMEDVGATEAAHKQVSCSELEGQLAFKEANFNFLPEGIKSLQQKEATLEYFIALLKKKELPISLGKVSGVSRK